MALVNPFLAPDAEPAAPKPVTPAVDQAAPSGFVNPFLPEQQAAATLDEWGPDVVTPPGRWASILGSFAQGGARMLADIPREVGLQTSRSAVDTLGFFDSVDSGGDFNRLAARADTPGKLSYLRGNEQERAALRDEATKAVAAPQQSAFYKAGEAMDAWVAKNAPTNPEYEKEFWSGKVPAGLGSMFAFMGEGLLMRRPLERAGLSRKQAVGGGALAGGTTSQAVSGFQDAIEKGASLEDAFKSHDLNRILGASEAVPIASILDRIDKGTGGLIKRTLINGMKGGTEEAIQESFQNIISNLIASDVVKYDPQRGMWTGTGEGAAVGFTTGGLVSVLGTLMFGRRANVGDDNQTPLTPEQQQAADSLLTPSVSGPIERTTPPAAATAPTATAAAPDMAALAEAPPATEQTPAAQTPASRPMVGVALSEQPADGLSVEVTDANGTVDPAAPGTPVVDPVAEAAPANAATTEQASVGLDLTALGNEVVDQESIATKAPQEVVEQPADAVTDTVLMDPDDISVDAQRFQFKGGTDTQGVSPQLKGVRKWDNRASGVSVVWEDQQGQRFVVDGHQRVALAKRLKAEGQAPKVRAIVLREADGITPAEARFIGAIKNLQEGGESTSAVDVARVIREGGRVEQVADVIPPQRAAFRDGTALAKLADDAWGAVLNNQLDPAFAAEVGRRITDPAQQNGAVQALIRAEPENAVQARAMVDQIIQAGFDKSREQGGLFGADDVADTLLKERAKVLDTALKRLRGMKRVFSAAVTGETDLSGAGNVLNTEANKEAAGRNARIAETIARSANTAGDISTALTAAARAVRGGKPAAQAAREFLDAIAGTAEARGQPAGQDQEGGGGDQVTIGGYPVGGLGEKALKTAAENATDPAERKAAQDELARRGVAETQDSFELTPPTKTALQQEEERAAKAEKAEREREREAEKRRKADREAAQFELTGSKRPADATPRQTDLVPPKSDMLPTGSAYEAIKTRPGTTADQKAAGESALAAAERRIFGAVRTGVRKATTLLGSVISKDFRAQGFVSFTGKTIRSSRDLAVLAQVVRDPRFETFRVIFVNGAGGIIDEHVLSSRLPGAVHFPQNMPEIIAARAEKIGATGYYLLHNHPTGRPDASSDDLRLTSQFARGAPGFKSHVILDHNEYNTLSMLPSGLVGEKIVRDESLASVDLKASPEVPHHLLGEKIGSPKDAAAIGAMLKSANDVVVVVGTGADGKITGITEMTRRDFLLATAKGAGQRRLRNVVAAKRFMRETGATRLFAVVPDNPRRYFGAQQSGLFTDIVGMDGESTASNMMAEPRSFASAAELRGGKSYVGEPAFENDLIIQHNLTAENVLHADRMGGLAVPSLAVTTVTRPLNNFGGITLLGDRDMADPRRGTQVFGADIYSPRYPTVTYKLDAAARRRLEAALKPHVEKLGDGVGTVTRLDDLTGSRAFRRYAEKLAGHTPNYDERVGIAEQLLLEVGANETLFKGFTNTGRRYVPHTLDNVVKALKKDLRGGEGFNYGLPNLRAKVTPRFRSVEAIRKSKDKLVTRAAFEAVRDEMNAGLDDLAARISADIGSDRSTDTVVQVLTDAVSMGLPRALRENNVPRPSIETQQAMARFLAKLRDMPTEYFEAIIPRVAQFSEFRAAAVPTGTDPRAVAVLRGAGLKIVEYEKGNDIQRQGAIERAAQDDGLLFSRTAPVDTNSPAFKRWFGDSKVVDDAGRPLVMYHGTTGDIDSFDASRIRPADYDAPFNGFWFSSDQDTSPAMRGSSNVIPAYLAVKNPAPTDVWRKVVRDVNESFDGGGASPLRAGARSTHDEVRLRLEGMGYDGVLWVGPPEITEEQAAEFERSGEVTLRKQRGGWITLKRTASRGIDLYDGKEARQGSHITGGWDSLSEFMEFESERVWVVFRNTQIKSAISNTGDFSDTNPDITASRGTGPAAGRTVAAVEAEIEQQIGRSAYAKLRDHFVVVADTAALRDDMQRRGSKFTGMLYAKAFHGTPHIWAPEPGFPHGRPRLDKIGTGEGAAAFGWGWYGAESDAVGKEYKKVTPSALVPPIRTFKGEEITPGSPEYHAATLLEAAGKTLAGAKNEVRGWIKGARPGEDVTHYRAVLAVLDGAASKKDFGVKKASGQLYALDIPDDALPYLLDRDKALGEQTPEVRKSLEQTPPWRDGGSLIEAFDQYITGQALYAVISHRLGGDRAASEYLASIGIVGNRYRDAGSRGDTSTPTYNYVIWDQKTLDRIALLERNGEKLDAIRERERADAGADIAASRTADEAGRIKGLYDFSTDTSYIVAGSLTAQDSPWGVFLHEVGEHYGLERMLGEAGHKAVLRQAEALLRAGVKPIRAAAEQVNASENVGLSPKAASFNRQFAGRMRKDPRLAREVIAYLAESPANHNMPLMRRIIASVRVFLRKLGIIKSLSTDDIVTLVIRSARRAGGFSRRTVAPEARTEDAVMDGDEMASLPANTSAGEDSGPLFSRVRGTPDQEQAMEATIGPAPGEKRFGGFLAAISQTIGNVSANSVRQGMFDQFRSIAAYEERANAGVVMDAATSAWKMALTTKNLSSVVTAMMVRGPVELVNGEFRLMDGRKGLIDIFKPLADRGVLRLWEGWAAANRAQRLMAEGRENNFTQAQIDALLDLENQYPEFRTVLDEYQDFNKAVLDMAEAAGVIDPVARATWERNDYVPFYRIIEDAQEAMGPPGRRGIAKQSSGIRTLRGGEQRIGSVLENIVMNMAHLVDASYKNEAMRRTVELTDGIGMHAIEKDWKPAMIPDTALKRALEAHGVNVDNMTSAQKAEWSQVFSRVAPQGPDVVWVLKAGKPAYYRVTDPLLLRSVLSFGPQAAGVWMKTLKVARSTLTKGVTVTPEFMAANFVRDTLSTWVVSDRNLVPLWGAAKGFVKALTGSGEAMHDMMTMGGMSRGFYDVDPQNLRRSMEEKAHLRPVGIVRTLWRMWQRVGFAFEQANRIAIFEATRKKGGSRAEAAHQARDIMDFSMRGDWAAIQFLADTVPFLNARLQGLYKLGRGAAEHPVGFFIKGSLLTAATLMLLGANDDDDRYNALPEWEKDLYWHFWIDDEHFKIPKPFEIGALFATIPERVLRAASGRDANKTTRQAAMRMVSDTFAFNPIPQLFKPIIEDAMNYNLFMDRPIVPMRLARLPPEMQYDPWTSESLRELSAIMPPGPLRSPKRFEHLVRGYFGSVATYLTGIADRVVRAAVDSPQEPSGRATDIPVVGRFYKGSAPGQTRYTEVFYDMLDEAETAAGAVRELRRQGRMAEANDVALKNADVLRARLTLARQARMLTEINKRVRLVYYSTDMTPDQKRAKLDELSRMKDGIIRSTVERFER